VSSTYAESFTRLTDALDEIAAINPAFRTPVDQQDLMVGPATFIARAQAQQLRVLATADETRDASGRIRAEARLAGLPSSAGCRGPCFGCSPVQRGGV
jgi:hypothetical protein